MSLNPPTASVSASDGIDVRDVRYDRDRDGDRGTQVNTPASSSYHPRDGALRESDRHRDRDRSRSREAERDISTLQHARDRYRKYDDRHDTVTDIRHRSSSRRENDVVYSGPTLRADVTRGGGGSGNKRRRDDESHSNGIVEDGNGDIDADGDIMNGERSEETFFRGNRNNVYRSNTVTSTQQPLPGDGASVSLTSDMSEEDMLAAMGLPSTFNTTKGKEVPDPAVHMSGARLKSFRRYRQYMNRRGGFNRNLAPVQ